MALQIRPREETGIEKMLGGLGTGLGAGLQTGLQQLAQENLKDIITKRERARILPSLEKLFGPEMAQTLASLPQNMQQEAFKSILRPEKVGWFSTTSQVPKIFQDGGQDKQLPSVFPDQPIQAGAEQAAQPTQAAGEQPQAPDKGLWNTLSLGGIINPDIAKGLVQETAKGIVSGTGNLAKLPFSLAAGLSSMANRISGGKTGEFTVPEVIDQLAKLPEDALTSLIGETADPKTNAEAAMLEGARDVGELLSPGMFLGKASKLAKMLGKGSPWLAKVAQFLNIAPKTALKVSTVGNTAKWLIKEAGGGETQQNLGKMGSMLALPILGRAMFGREVSSLAQHIESTLPETSVGIHESSLMNLNRKLQKVINSKSSTTEAVEAAKDLSDIIIEPFNTQFTAKNIWGINKGIEEASKNPELFSAIKNAVPAAKKSVMDGLKTVGKDNEALSALVNKYEDYSGALNAESLIQKNLSRMGSPTRNPFLLGLLHWMKAPIRVSTVGLRVAGMAAGEAEKVIRLMFTNKAFRDAYGGVVNSAILGNVSQVQKGIKKMDQAIKKKKK